MPDNLPVSIPDADELARLREMLLRLLDEDPDVAGRIAADLFITVNRYPVSPKERAATPGERVIPIPLLNDGPFTLQVNNRAENGSAASGHVMRFNSARGGRRIHGRDHQVTPMMPLRACWMQTT
ncbi:MAG: hypothetical protein IPK52_12815 [Chloroflexi bacterium]|nr:hypothetical protein [Chloroflexota bacterium]